ncbi:MAG: P1 family peptidase [Chloroflexi bacterium]|nr:P1 family peptidase [Chloroflexota bacterium]
MVRPSNSRYKRKSHITVGRLPPGPQNAITDVAGVRVGHVTLIKGEGPLIPGEGPVRTGITVILPHEGDLFLDRVAGYIHTINGFGEVTNAHVVNELGALDGPIYLTTTLSVPRVADYMLDWAFEHYPQMGISSWGATPVVAECSDMFLNDMRGRHVTREHVFTALEIAGTGPVAEGVVGAGTGMSCFGFKGGIGTASRKLPDELGGFTIGVLVLSNFGRREQLLIKGVPVGIELRDWQGPDEELRPNPLPEDGHSNSIIIVMATDAPLSSRLLGRVSTRCVMGLARTGGNADTTSGDFIIAFSTTHRKSPALQTHTRQLTLFVETVAGINALFQAAAEATEEAILNALFKAHTVVGRDNHVRYALPIRQTVDILRHHGYPETGRRWFEGDSPKNVYT